MRRNRDRAHPLDETLNVDRSLEHVLAGDLPAGFSTEDLVGTERIAHAKDRHPGAYRRAQHALRKHDRARRVHVQDEHLGRVHHDLRIEQSERDVDDVVAAPPEEVRDLFSLH
jgi:hypothetical protein